MPTLTPYPDINDIVRRLVSGLVGLLGARLVGVYLTGSLSYGDFDRGSSDIDLLVALAGELSVEQRGAVAQLHRQVGERYPAWTKRVEASYVTRGMLASGTLPPLQGRPYVNVGRMWEPDPRYGNEWLLNLYVLRECGRVLYGPPIATLVPEVNMIDVRAASRRDFHAQWEALLDDPSFLADPHHQAYITLTLCRILHRARNDAVASKRTAANWVVDIYGGRWEGLITEALSWRHGQSLSRIPDILDFIRFVGSELAAG